MTTLHRRAPHITTRDPIRAEISNWVAWCWLGEAPGPRHQHRCGSAEGSYLNFSHLAQDDDPSPPPPIINADHARRVQKRYDALPHLARQVVRFEYLQRRVYDIWEPGEEVGPDGNLRKTWLRTGNNRRLAARLKLKIGRQEYLRQAELFKTALRREFDLP